MKVSMGSVYPEVHYGCHDDFKHGRQNPVSFSDRTALFSHTKTDLKNLTGYKLSRVAVVQVFTGSLEKMAPQPLRPNSVVVPWPGHWHLHLGSPYFSRPFDPVAHRDARQYLAMESLKVLLPAPDKMLSISFWFQ